MTTDLFHSEGVFIAAPELKEKTRNASPIPDGHSGICGPLRVAGGRLSKRRQSVP
jgi:hypothetical protein